MSTTDNLHSRERPADTETAAAPKHLSQAETATAVANLAAGLAEPRRAAEVVRHHAALLSAMNASCDANGEQDALCAFEAIAILLGQMLGGASPSRRPGVLSFITHRALFHAGATEQTGGAAHFLVVPDDDGHGGHA